MSLVTHPHRWAGAGLLAVCAWVVGQVPRQLQSLHTTIKTIPGQVVGQVDKHAGQIEQIAREEIQASRKEVLAGVHEEIAALRGDVMPLTYAAVGVVNQARGDVVRQVEGVREDLRPVIENSQALVKDVQDSIDDLYWDVKAMIESATVAAASAGQASEEISRAVPRFLLLGEQITQNLAGVTEDVHGITTDLHKVTTKFTAPKTRAQKAWGVAEAALMIGVRAGIR